jgi:phosphotransferase system enzyme I (PtsI)
MKTRRFTSLATSPGIAIGQAFHLRSSGPAAIVRTWVRDQEVDVEIERFKDAIRRSKEQLSRIQSKMCRFQGSDQINIIESYRLFLQDDMLVNTTIDHIMQSKINAEWALDKTLNHLRLSFLNVHEEYLKERQQDIDYVGRRIMDNLLGHDELTLQELPKEDVVILAHDLSPAEIASFPKEIIKGFIMEVGGETSHTAIIARALEIPAIFGVKDIGTLIQDGETVILDGMKGLAIASPGKRELEQYRAIHQRYVDLEKMLLEDINLPAETKDGYSMRLDGNMELVEEIPSLIQHGAEGIGLYRTEYLFLNRLDEPSEEEQFNNYVEVLKSVYPRPVTIRTIDLGADKLTLRQQYEEQTNPALGLRGIRLCLKESALFKTQLRALLRASAHGSLKIMLPMITNIKEVIETKKLIRGIADKLKKENISFDQNIPLGIMVEVPATIQIAEELAREVDFFSIGTNDLIQYGLAIDRGNELVSNMYTPFHPAILRMMVKAVDAAKSVGIPISVCGEMAGDPLTIVLLVGMGLDSLSMNPVSLPRVKKILRSISQAEAKKLLEKALSLNSADEIEKLVRKEIGHLLPPQIQQAVLASI